MDVYNIKYENDISAEFLILYAFDYHDSHEFHTDTVQIHVQ